MAELFGVVAGAVGLAAAGLQVAETAVKLRSAYKAYRGAKEDVNALISELLIIQHLIEASQSSSISIHGSRHNNALLTKCRLLCTKAKDSIEMTLYDIEAGLEMRSKREAVAFVLRKPKVLECFARLESAKSLLFQALQICHGTAIGEIHDDMTYLRSLAGQMKDANTSLKRVDQLSATLNAIQIDIAEIKAVHQADEIASRSQLQEANQKIHSRVLQYQAAFAEHTQGTTTLTQRADTLNDEIQHISATLMHDMGSQPSTTALSTMSTTTFECMLFRYEHTTKTGHTRHHKSKGKDEIRIFLPTWFVQMQWVGSVVRSITGWRNPLRAYRILPDNNEAFEACMSGDVQLIRDLLVNKKVSLNDQNEEGLTMLHIAAFSHQYELCRFLIHQGARIHALSSNQDSPMHEVFYTSPYKTGNLERTMSLFHYLQQQFDEAGADIELEEQPRIIRLFLSYPIWSLSDHVDFVLKLHAPLRVIHAATPEYSANASAIALRQDLLAFDGASAQTLTSSSLYMQHISTPLHLAAGRYAEAAFAGTELDQGDITSWKMLCIDMVVAGAVASHRAPGMHEWTTPLGYAIKRAVTTLIWHQAETLLSTTILNRVLNNWLELLREAGIDTTMSGQYAKEEMMAFQQGRADACKEVHTSFSARSGDVWEWWLAHYANLDIREAAGASTIVTRTESTIDEQAHVAVNNACDHISHQTPVVPGSWVFDSDGVDHPCCTQEVFERRDSLRDPQPSIRMPMLRVHKVSLGCVRSLLEHSAIGRASRGLQLGDLGRVDRQHLIELDHEKTCECQACKRNRALQRKAALARKTLQRQASDWIQSKALPEADTCRVPYILRPAADGLCFVYGWATRLDTK